MIKNRHTCRKKQKKKKLPVKYVYLLVSCNEYLCMKMFGFIVVFCFVLLERSERRNKREELNLSKDRDVYIMEEGRRQRSKRA